MQKEWFHPKNNVKKIIKFDERMKTTDQEQKKRHLWLQKVVNEILTSPEFNTPTKASIAERLSVQQNHFLQQTLGKRKTSDKLLALISREFGYIYDPNHPDVLTKRGGEVVEGYLTITNKIKLPEGILVSTENKFVPTN